MALRGASSVTVDQDWLDFKELAKENAAVLFSVREIEEEQKFANGEFSPVKARVIVLTGKHAGEVYPSERILAAGIRNKLTEAGEGEDVVGRIRPYGARKHPGLEAEEDGDIELAEAALVKLKNGRAKPKTTEPEDADDEPEVPAQRRASNGTRAKARSTQHDDEDEEPPARTRRTKAAPVEDDSDDSDAPF